MARITQETKDQVRLSLLQVAADHFARDGFERANINAIAQEAGFAKGTIYNYFNSKEVLFGAVLAEACRQVAAQYGVLNIESTTQAHLLAIARADVAVMQDYEPFIQVLVREAMSFRPNTYPLLIENLAPVMNLLGVILQIGQERGEVRSDVSANQLALVFIGQLSMLYVQYWGSAGAWPALDEIPELAVNLFLNGVGSNDLTSRDA
jgi:AcrR family transcriptional regulator